MNIRCEIKQKIIEYLEEDVRAWREHLRVVFECELTEEMADIIQTLSVKIQTVEEIIDYIRKFS